MNYRESSLHSVVGAATLSKVTYNETSFITGHWTPASVTFLQHLNVATKLYQGPAVVEFSFFFLSSNTISFNSISLKQKKSQ